MKISFDFDDTLNRPAVERFAANCIRHGYDVSIVTSRFHDLKMSGWNSPVNNNDLWEVVDRLQIPTKNVHFTGMVWKADFFIDNPDFRFHLDDDVQEINQAINSGCPVPFVNSKSSFWIKQCMEFMS